VQLNGAPTTFVVETVLFSRYVVLDVPDVVADVQISFP
jgi:hypothetical protein